MGRFDTAVRKPEYNDNCQKILSTEFANIFKELNSEEEYESLLASLDELTNITNSLYMMDNHGSYPILNNIPAKDGISNLDELKTAYNKVYSSTESLLKKFTKENINDNPNYKKSGKTLISLNRLLRQDTALLNTFSSDEFVSLPELMYRSGVKTYDAKDVVQKKVGGNQSSRIPMKLTDSDGKTIEGFFTENTIYDPFTEFEKAVKEVSTLVENDYPENVLTRFNAFTDDTIQKKAGKRFEYIRDRHPDTKEKMDFAYVVKHYDVYSLPNLLEGLSESETKQFLDALKKLTKEFSKHYSLQDSINQSREMSYGANIDRRNSAMSDVASLLGIRHLIAESEDVRIIDSDGKEHTGTFMEMADGVPIDSVRFTNEKQFTGQAKKDLSDLQILDYLCFNVDRHSGNLFYKQDDANRITGIIGIDNDASFGKKEEFENVSFNRLTNISSIKYISKDLSEKLLNLDKATYRAALESRGIPAEEIAAFGARLEDCQELAKTALRNLDDINNEHLEEDDFAVALSDKIFAKIKMDDFVKEEQLEDNDRKYKNIFHRLKTYSNDLHEIPPKEFERIDMSDKEAKEFDTSEKTENGLRDTLRLLIDYKNKFDDATSFFRGSSKNYKDMQTEVNNAIDTLSEILSDKGVTKMSITPEDFATCKKALNKVFEKTNHYIFEKSREEKRSNYAENRLNLAKDFSNNLKKSVSSIEYGSDYERTNMEVMNINKISSSMLEEIGKTEEAMEKYNDFTDSNDKATFIFNDLPKLSSQAYEKFNEKIDTLINNPELKSNTDLIGRLNVAKNISDICKKGKEAYDILSTNTEYQGEKLGENHTFKNLSECKLAFLKMKIVDNVINAKYAGNVQKTFELYQKKLGEINKTNKSDLSLDETLNSVIKGSSFFEKFESMNFRETQRVLDDSNISNRKQFISLNTSMDNALNIQKEPSCDNNTPMLIKNTRIK